MLNDGPYRIILAHTDPFGAMRPIWTQITPILLTKKSDRAHDG